MTTTDGGRDGSIDAFVADLGGSPDAGTDASRDVGGADACPGGCVILGACVPNETRNPTNQCEVCHMAVSATDWSPNSGATCDDGMYCTTGDVCTGTNCHGTARNCSDGIACDGIETCSEAMQVCLAGTPTCIGGTICNRATDTCVATCTGCVIGGNCFGAGQLDPSNACRVCDPARSATAFSNNDGTRCDDGHFCTAGDLCTAGACQGTPRNCSDGVTCNGLETCSDAAMACVPGTTTCAPGQLCDVTTDTCRTSCSGCVIGGICYAAMTTSPSNACVICDPTRSPSAFSPADGARCDDGVFCTTNDTCSGGLCAGTRTNFCDDGVACNGVETCNDTTRRCVPGATTCSGGTICNPASDSCVATCSGCVIGGVCFASGTINPANQCQTCDTATSASAWTARMGSACTNGLFCSIGTTCNASAQCAGGSTRNCSDGIVCNGLETCSESLARCVAGTTTCAAGQLCNTATDSCVTTCGGCVIGGICYAAGTTNPANACQTCNTATSSTAWTPRTGMTCSTGAFCVTGETCTASATCTGTPRNCSDGIACNGLETCDALMARCVAGTTTCTGGLVCNTSTDTCAPSCSGNTMLCSGSCVDTRYDPAHCGNCTTSCPSYANATPVCASSSCALVCVAGFANCDTTLPDCETNLTNSVLSCGQCARACATYANTTTGCASSACTFTCAMNFGNCDTTLPDCETNLLTSAAHCGSCTNACTAPQTCMSGVCG